MADPNIERMRYIQCYRVVNSMWGNTCNTCRAQNKQSEKLVSALNKNTDSKQRETALAIFKEIWKNKREDYESQEERTAYCFKDTDILALAATYNISESDLSQPD